jgi:NAD(P)-dependent dehydrogenase (short-subunit alcohol dehydrogenase family)
MITDRLSIAGRTIVVTGAGGAIGAVVAHALAEAGALTVLVDQDPDRLDAVTAGLRAEGRPHVAGLADACDPEALRTLLATVRDDHGPPDGLVALIGGVHGEEFGPFLGTGAATYDAIVDRNLRSAAVTLEVVAGAMVDAGRGGSLVAISAATALASAPYHGMYAAAKAAVISLARTLAVELGPLGIRVNTVAPGAVATRPAIDPDEIARMERAAIPLGRRVQPIEIAAAALFLLSDLSSAVTGQTLVLDGGALAKPAFLDADDVPVFVTDRALRERMRAGATRRTAT